MNAQRRRSIVLSLLCLGVSAAPALAQTGAVAGRVRGADTGHPISGALVEARDPANRASRRMLTDLEGAFRLPRLESGTYSISVTAVGYGTRDADTLYVKGGETATLSIALEPKPIELNPLVVTSSRKVEKAIEAPAHVETVTGRDIAARPAITVVDHLRATPAVDVVTGGLQATRIVVRGFNSGFSGSLHTLTDHRFAGLRSLHVNLLGFLPQVNDDIERVEVVLGPGAALYGPNTANGVLHIITRSPIDQPGSTVSVTGGERGVLHFTGRSAARLSNRFGFKISGQYFQGDDWRSTDPVEEKARRNAEADFDAWKRTQPVGLSEAELRQRADRIGARDFRVSRYSVDARADWRPSADLSAVLTAGMTNVGSAIEMSGVGAGMFRDWRYGYYQARLSSGSWFAQAYLNTSDAGDTFVLRNGAPIIDRSRIGVVQLQHSSNWRGVDVTYGADLVRTEPVTGGTIHGGHEDNDQYSEYGAYLQTKAGLRPGLDLVLAGRWDRHTALNDPVFSPRAALVARPAPEHTFRLTYNRAFATPSSLDLFIDMDFGPDESLGQLGFRRRAHGSGKNGIDLADDNGWPRGMRVPGQAGLVDITAENVFDAQLKLLIGMLQADPATRDLAPLMQALGPALKAGAAQLPVVALIDPGSETRRYEPVAGSVTDVPGIRPSISSTWEVGYTGLIAERLRVAADVWRSTVTDFTSSLLLRTPLFLLGPPQFEAFLSQNAAPQIVSALRKGGLTEADALQQAQAVIATWVEIPGGVASSEDVETTGADLLMTNVNLGEIHPWGFDLSAQWLISEGWSVRGTYSHVSHHSYCLIDPGTADCDAGDLLALNAPNDKLTASLAYRGPRNGLNGEVRMRHTGGFPVKTSVYKGLACIGGGGAACVNVYTLIDVVLGADLPIIPGASVQLAVTNLLDEDYRSFVGVPTVGRLALLRLRYEF
jgi:outer membrane receptor for ferrienterochelin and colicins